MGPFPRWMYRTHDGQVFGDMVDTFKPGHRSQQARAIPWQQVYTIVLRDGFTAPADVCGPTRQPTVAREAGRYAPSLELAFRIARAFGVGVKAVFHWEGGRMNRPMQALTWAALTAFVAGLIGFALPATGYLHGQHPVALLGARQWPGAIWFNLVVFVLPGLLMVPVALRLYSALAVGAGFWCRIGARLGLLSVLGFALQGLLPLDLDDLDGAGSKWHAAAWLGWWLAFVPGALLLAFGRIPAPWVGVAAASVLLIIVWAPPAWLPAGAAQRLACLLWFGWWAMAAHRMDVARSVPTTMSARVPARASAEPGDPG